MGYHSFYIVALLSMLAIVISTDLGLKQFDCSYLQFNVTYDVVPSRSIVIYQLVANCSGGTRQYQIADASALNYHKTGTHKVTYDIPPTLPEISRCYLGGRYRPDIRNPNSIETNIPNILSCVIPRTEVECTTSPVVMNNTIINKDYTKSIDCKVKSSKFVNITWIKNGNILEEKDNLNITYVYIDNSPDHRLSVSTISFISLKLSDSGSYECKINRTNTNDNYLIGSATCNVAIYVLEKFQSTSPTPVNATRRDDFFTSISPVTKGDQMANERSDVLYQVIGILAFALMVAILCTMVVSARLIYLRGKKNSKLPIHAFDIVYPSTRKVKFLNQNTNIWADLFNVIV